MKRSAQAKRRMSPLGRSRAPMCTVLILLVSLACLPAVLEAADWTQESMLPGADISRVDIVEANAVSAQGDQTASLVQLQGFRLYAECLGSGPVTILFEPGLGGSAFEWQHIQGAMAPRARACTYDRGGYGRSDVAPLPRDARKLAREADELLSRMGIEGPLILVGHSFGGFIARLLAERRNADMLALVLVDASHENQLQRLERANGKRMMPSGRVFVISPPVIPDSLSADVRQKIQRYSRQRKNFATLHAEMASFRLSAEQVRNARVTVSYPVIVLQRGRDLYADDNEGAVKTAIWQELQVDLARLSAQGNVIVAENSGHHVHADEPQLLVETLSALLDSADSTASAGQRQLP